MGTVTMNLEEGAIPTARFTFTGVDGGVAVVANPTGVFTAWTVPEAVNNTNSTTLKFGATYSAGAFTGGTAICSRGLSLDVANDVQFLPMLGPCQGVDIARRLGTCTFSLETTAAQEVTFINNVISNTTQSLAFEHGTVAGRKLLVFAPAAQVNSPKDADFNGRQVLSLGAAFQGTNNDALRIVCA